MTPSKPFIYHHSAVYSPGVANDKPIAEGGMSDVWSNLLEEWRAEIKEVGADGVAKRYGSSAAPKKKRKRGKLLGDYTAAEIDEIIQIYQSGASLQRTATRAGCCATTAQKILKAAGIPRRPALKHPTDSSHLEGAGSGRSPAFSGGA